MRPRVIACGIYTVPTFRIWRCAASTSSNVHHDANLWPGLNMWRSSGCDERRIWGPKGPEAPQGLMEAPPPSLANSPVPASLADYGRRVLLTPDPIEKAEITHQAWRAFTSGLFPVGSAQPPPHPARPPRPELLPPRLIPSLKQTHLPLNVYTLHNLAHVELNAIDLAWDTVVRFSNMNLPERFYADFARVADDESRHLTWCLQRLEELGYEYGCMPAHDLLWKGCVDSAGNLSDRLAVVPLSQEARGLDAGQRLSERLVGWGDNRSAAIVAKIADEERAHVAVGVAWFRAVCGAIGVDPATRFAQTLTSLCPDLLKGPFNHEAREEVGLAREWYDQELWPKEAASTRDGSTLGRLGGQHDVEELRERLEALVATEIHLSQ